MPIKTLIWVVTALFLVSIGIVLFSGSETEVERASESPDEITVEGNLSTSRTIVSRIIDSDTFEMSDGSKVRLICINTPEEGEKYYNESIEYIESLILNKEVVLTKDVSEKDVYGRLLRYVYLQNGTFVNEVIVRQGYGKVFRYGNDTRECPIIEAAEEIAREENKGMWSEENSGLQANVNITINSTQSQNKEEQSNEGNSTYVCSSDTYNCGDFKDWQDAQEVFDACFASHGDVHRLDADEDGEACESLPRKG